MLVFHTRAFYNDNYKYEHSEDNIFHTLTETRQKNDLLAAELAHQTKLLEERKEIIEMIDNLPLKTDLVRKTAHVIQLINDNEVANDHETKNAVQQIVFKLEKLSCKKSTSQSPFKRYKMRPVLKTPAE